MAIDLSTVTDYASFERAYDELIALLESVLNDDNMFEHNGERFYSHVREDGDRTIGEEPRARDGYRAIRFADETTVTVTQPERGQANGMSFDYEVDIAMAVALQSAVSLAASNYARKDPANWSQRRASEIDRLWRALNPEWADHLAQFGWFQHKKS